MRAQRTRYTISVVENRSLVSCWNHILLTVSVYEGVVVVVSADVRLQRGVREGGRRPVPVAHNSHLEHRV